MTARVAHPYFPPLVLVVEDDDNIATALEFLVLQEGYRHKRVASGAEALLCIKSLGPDLVLLDVMLPEVSGYEICRHIRSDPVLSDVKVLMMTARGSAIEHRKSEELGANGFISKPFDLKDLRAEVRRLLTA